MRTWRTHGDRRWITGAVAVVAVVGTIIAIAIGLAAGTPPEKPLATPSGASRIPPIVASGVAPLSVPLIHAGLAPGKAILTSMVDSLSVFDAPDGAVTRSLGQYTYYSRPLTLMAIDAIEADGNTWYEVSLPAKPNGQTGWVRASEVIVSSTDTVIHVYLAQHELDVVVGGAVELTAPVAVGSPKTPTPLGTFYITDPIDLSANPTGVYGAYALGLSAYSEALDSFKGTIPQIAIHGTNVPGSIGQSVSNGCIRMQNDAVRDLGGRVGIGTPVIVSAARPEA